MPQVVITVINYGFLGFCEMSLLALTPLMWSTSLEHGGLGFTPSTIGLTIAVYGILSTFFQATVVGKVVRCFGPRKVFIGGFVPMLVSISCFPLEGYLARRTGHTDWRVWTVIIVHLVMYCLGTASYSKLHFLQMLSNITFLMFIVRCDAGFDHGQCAMPVCPWFCEWAGSGCRIRFKGPGAFLCVIVICRLTAAKLGRRKCSLLHIDRYCGLYDPTFFNAAKGVAFKVNSLFRDAYP